MYVMVEPLEPPVCISCLTLFSKNLLKDQRPLSLIPTYHPETSSQFGTIQPRLTLFVQIVAKCFKDNILGVGKRQNIIPSYSEFFSLIHKTTHFLVFLYLPA